MPEAQPKDKATTMTKPIKHQTVIEVSQKELDEAYQGNSSHCMIQQSIKHTNLNAKQISVDLQTIRWTDRRNGVRYVWLTPLAAQQALVQFDQGVKLEPFAFRLAPHPIAETSDGNIAPPGGGKPRKARKGARRGSRVRIRRAAKGAITVTTEGHPLPPIAALPGNRRQFGLKQLKIGAYAAPRPKTHRRKVGSQKSV